MNFEGTINIQETDTENFNDGDIVYRFGTDPKERNTWDKADTDEDFTRMNPFYACIVADGKKIRLHIAIAEGNQLALEFRDKWLENATQDEKNVCGYDEKKRNFIGGGEGEDLKSRDAA